VVLTNQLSLYVILAFAFGLPGKGNISAYTYGWSIMQMPYAVVVVSVLGVLTPQLAGLSTSQDFAGLGDRLRFGLRQSLVIIIPCTLVLVVFAQPIVAIALHHANGTKQLSVGIVLAVLAAGLPGFTVFQLCVRGLQSMQRAREVFFLYALENILTIALAIVLGRHSLAGLIASVSVAYSAAAVVALLALARHQVRVASVIWARHVRRSLWASLFATLVMALVYASSSSTHGLGLVLRFFASFAAGIVAYVVVVLLGQRSVERKTARRVSLE
jgi:putative peptidoglycan lipid II flippase